jgi:hypothetical protein
VFTLTLGKAIQFLKKRGEGNGGAIGVTDDGVSIGGEAGDGKGHGDTVVAAGIDFGAPQFSGAKAGNLEAVRAFFDHGVHAAKIFSKRGDAVAFFDTKFGGIPNLNSFLSVGTESGEHRQFVNH